MNEVIVRVKAMNITPTSPPFPSPWDEALSRKLGRLISKSPRRLKPKAMKSAGMLSPGTDVEALAKKAFIHLDGVTDAWIEGLQIEKLAGGAIPSDQPLRLAAELSTVGTPFKIATCCAPASRVAPRPGITEESKVATAK